VIPVLNKIIHGDCLEVMPQIPSGSIDMILCDLPYGTTACKWDTVIPFEPLWEQYERIIKDNGAIVLFGSQPFTSSLVMSKLDLFKYELIWEKDKASNFMLAKRQIQKYHENILVFYKEQCTYNPIMWDAGRVSNIGGSAPKLKEGGFTGSAEIGEYIPNSTLRYPKSILKFNTPKANDGVNMCLHPTQKPVALFEYLIKTYTNEGEIVLDNCIGSGTTAIAALNTGRYFIGIEKEKKYFDIAKERIANHTIQQRLKFAQYQEKEKGGEK
jgi:site-specific DNA-methyltransferase (adenine-specific)